MSGSKPQGHRSGEGTANLYSYITDDDKRKEGEPDRSPNQDASQQYGRDDQQQSSQEGGPG